MADGGEQDWFRLDRNEYPRWETVRSDSAFGFEPLSQRTPDKHKAYMESTKYAPFGKIKGKQVHGGPSKKELWPLQPQYIGEDYQLELYPGYTGQGPPPKPALSSAQISQLKSDIIRNVVFRAPIGMGPNGVVWRVDAEIDRNMGQGWDNIRKRRTRDPQPFQFAVKVIQNDPYNQTQTDISLKDIKFLRYLKHENICNLWDVIGVPDRQTGYPDAILCSFFDLCDGKFKFFRKNFPLAEKLTRHWFAQMVSALEYLHRKGVVHLNISDQNILYKKRPNFSNETTFEGKFLECIFKLSDFGEARQYFQKIDENIKRRDLMAIFNILLDNLPGANMPNKLHKFLTFCRTNQWVEGFPKEWTYIPLDFRDMFQGMAPNRAKVLSAFKLMTHEWVQRCKEHRTMPFIYRGELVSPNPDTDLMSNVGSDSESDSGDDLESLHPSEVDYFEGDPIPTLPGADDSFGEDDIPDDWLE